MADSIFSHGAHPDLALAQSTAPRFPERFYRTRERSESRAEQEGAQRPAEITVMVMPEPLRNAKIEAYRIVIQCHWLVGDLEVERMTKSRLGVSAWSRYWHNVYSYYDLRKIGDAVSAALHDINVLYLGLAVGLHELLERTDNQITHSSNEAMVAQAMTTMEQEVDRRWDRCRHRAHRTIEIMRDTIQSELPLVISDDLLDRMKRGIFALTPDYGYAPGRTYPETPEPEPQELWERSQEDYMLTADPFWDEMPPFENFSMVQEIPLYGGPTQDSLQLLWQSQGPLLRPPPEHQTSHTIIEEGEERAHINIVVRWDPNLDQTQSTWIHANDEWNEIAPGYRPVGAWQRPS
ncbi:hypothetical protein NUU61_000223 [Penicillium alfredii]|uniref:Uncharacterized protein n=1 Tax=Penicillium alfredii TaxID=1506179 RepID=A0A9W9KPJ2_9EURO|nr:uncharacterized protein NUU61_000223 [Penicillium alfredii]KAJ5114464.1 hypothetical protein NUU61_000223 [Penicillium alfredii]